jgi:exonuclease SbcC
MKIELKKLSLLNFKGIRELTVQFDFITNILGMNATGKSSLLDAFLWLLFGKDSSDRKDFEIKTLDKNNIPFHRLSHEVAATFLVDGVELILRRTYKEKWVKKRGSSEEEFTGHETDYYWNDVPLKQEDYQKKIASLINENIFKLLTSITYFNSLKWQDRRSMLMQIAGVIDDNEILDSLTISTEHKTLLAAAMKQGKGRDNFKDYRAELGAKKKKIKDELILLPSRIDEAKRSLPEEKDYVALENEIFLVTQDIDRCDGLLMNKTKAQKEHQQLISEKIQEVHKLMTQLQEIEYSLRDDVVNRKRDREVVIMDKKNDLRLKHQELGRLLNEYDIESKRKTEQDAWATNLRTEWNKINDEKLVFDDNEFSCPACKRAYETSDIQSKKDELTANFNTSKSQRLASISERGKTIAEEVKLLTAKLSNIKASGESMRSEITAMQEAIAVLEEQHIRLSADDDEQLKQAIAAHAEHKRISAIVQLKNEEISAPYSGEDNTALLQRKRELSTNLDQLKSEVATKGIREKQLARIDELIGQEGTMAHELASLEGIEFSIEQFTKARMDTLEKRINMRFRMVRFKMFEEQINGGQVEACTTLIDGVPYPDANTASKIQAALDIIRVFNEHYELYAPIFIDNRESVINIPAMDAQIINLIVSPTHKKLTVEAGKQEMALA